MTRAIFCVVTIAALGNFSAQGVELETSRRRLVLLRGLTGQPAALPPAYPRPGATKLLENERAIVWDIAWLKQQYPLHRHLYDLVGVYYSPGDRIIIAQDGTRRPISTRAWETAFQLKGVTHIEEGSSDEPLRAVFLELKEPQALGVTDSAASPAAFPAGRGRQLRDNERAIVWEFVPPPAASPHRHQRDAVVVAFTGTSPRVTFVERGTSHAEESTAGADRVYVFELK